MNLLKKKAKKDIIAFRKTCKTSGIGLAHYILLDKK
ncbi:MAG: modified peptide precursor CbpA [Candidatus Omnitrophica bacterium]|nr:modified peptide precursor CbpA [Candidatus Omnitrophota bacterium]